jgi:hypothetical protein
MAQGDADAGSDLDLLADYRDGSSLFDQIGFTSGDGRAAAPQRGYCHTPKSLHWFIRDTVLAEARPVSTMRCAADSVSKVQTLECAHPDQ